MEKDCRLINLDIIKTEKPGVLVPINDIKKELDMDVKRVFYIYGFTENIQSNNRGYHAHENTKQVLINIRGSVNIKVRKARLLLPVLSTFVAPILPDPIHLTSWPAKIFVKIKPKGIDPHKYEKKITIIISIKN